MFSLAVRFSPPLVTHTSNLGFAGSVDDSLLIAALPYSCAPLVHDPDQTETGSTRGQNECGITARKTLNPRATNQRREGLQHG
jgi:hypothetical protein